MRSRKTFVCVSEMCAVFKDLILRRFDISKYSLAGENTRSVATLYPIPKLPQSILSKCKTLVCLHDAAVADRRPPTELC